MFVSSHFRILMSLLLLLGLDNNLASDISWGKKGKFRGICKDKSAELAADFVGIFASIFGERFAENCSVKKPLGRKLCGQVSLENDCLFADFRNIFNEKGHCLYVVSIWIILPCFVCGCNLTDVWRFFHYKQIYPCHRLQHGLKLTDRMIAHQKNKKGKQAKTTSMT